MAFHEIEDPAEFARRVDPLLATDPARHTVQLGILDALQHDPGRYGSHRLWLVEDGAGAAAAAVQTAPYPPLIARPRDDASLIELAQGMHAGGVDLHGVNGAEPEVGRFAEEWARLAGTRSTVRMSLRLHALEEVRPVPPSPGRARHAGDDDFALLLDWMAAFIVDTGVNDDPEQNERLIRSRLAGDPPTLWLWEVDGQPVSLAGYSGASTGAARVGPVYTPPEQRGHGYATSLVAELTEHLLAVGHPGCLLYTDLANPTSNAIYRRIGYLPVCDSSEYEFGALS
jgi:uncharacterized protein